MSFTKGDTFTPSDLNFKYINEKTKEPDTLDLSKYKDFVIVGLPAAFSPTCSEQHVPAYVGHLKEFADKGVLVVIISRDNLFALNAWSKQLKVSDKQSEIIFASDVDSTFIKRNKLTTTEFGAVLGEVSSRFAILIKDGVVAYFGKEKSVGDVDLSSAEKVLSFL